jgi:hypothetical protein
MQAVVDNGPLVALFDRSERHHVWAATQVERPDAPLLVCVPVLTEAIYLLARCPEAQDALFHLLEHGAVELAFRLDKQLGALEDREPRSPPRGHLDAA